MAFKLPSSRLLKAGPATVFRFEEVCVETLRGAVLGAGELALVVPRAYWRVTGLLRTAIAASLPHVYTHSACAHAH